MNNKYYDQKLEELLVTQYGITLTKKNLSEVLHISVSSINNYIVKGSGLPNYTKIGTSKNGTVLFPVINVVDYLSNTIKVS